VTGIQAAQVAARAGSGGLLSRARNRLRAAAAARPALRSRASAAKAAAAPIEPSELVLAVDRGPSGSLAVATREAVYCQDRPGGTWTRRAWEDVTRVAWDDQRRLLRLTGIGPRGIWRKDLTLRSGTVLVDLARERVTATRLASTDVRAGGRVCALVTARRRPGSGAVVWTVVLNETAAAGYPEIRAAVAAAIDGLRAGAGIPASGAVIQAAGQELREMDAADPGELVELSAAGETVG